MKKHVRSTIATTTGLTLLGFGLAAPAQAAAPNACAERADCVIVSRADVDGDGVRDSVGMRAAHQGDGTDMVTLWVATADGERLSTVTETLASKDHYRGSARVDGEDGYEIVLRTDLGAHTGYYRVVTYRDGRLTTLQDPRSRYRWTTDGSVWSDFGYQKTTSGTGAYKFVAREAVDGDRDGDFTQLTVASGWSTAQRTWKRMGTTTRHDISAATAHRYTGWHVPYLTKGI